MIALSLVFGTIVGFALGLTGGGGSILAVPMLVYGLGVPAHQAVGVSLTAVGATSAWGLIQRLRHHEVELRQGLIFALFGMVGAPLGAWLNGLVSQEWLLGMFACLMLVVAVRMWIKAGGGRDVEPADEGKDATAESIVQDPSNQTPAKSGSGVLLVVLGLMTGVFSGLFGVGGGIIIVPALVLATDMPIKQAVATSLLVITMVSISGVASYWWADRPIDFLLAAIFATGGIVGMTLGTALSRRLSGPTLQKGFAVFVVAVAAWMLAVR